MEYIRLFLTVGTNPLPVWVGWRRLSDFFQSNGKNIEEIILVYTEESEDEMDRLLYIINNEIESLKLNQKVVKCKTDSAIGITIEKNVKTYASNHVSQIHIHYTGGSKAMAVHSVLGLESLEGKTQVTASYLDSHEQNPKIILQTGETLGSDCRKTFYVTIDQIAELHGLGFINIDQPYPPIKKPPEFLSEQQTIGEQFWHNMNCIDIEKFESATCMIVDNILKGKGHYHIYHSVAIRPQKGDGVIYLGVVIILGYQIITICCGRRDKNEHISKKQGEIKLQAMEVSLGTQQLGGNEARTIFLCEFKNQDQAEGAKEVEAELYDEMGMISDEENEVGGKGYEIRQIRIWGKDIWEDREKFEEKLKEYLCKDLAWIEKGENNDTLLI